MSARHLVEILTRPHFEAYHPLHLLSYWLDVPLAGTSGPAIHAVSLGLFILSLLAVFEASRALRLGWLGALAATLVVGLHPIQVEAVTWASGRKDVLALGFCALSVLAHCRSEALFDRWRLASLVAFGLAALSKTTALPLPLALVAADVFLFRRRLGRALLAQGPALLVALGLGALTVAIWSGSEMIRGREIDAAGRVALVAATLSHHLATLAFPARLSPVYPIHRGEPFSALELLGGPLALAAALLAAHRSRSPHLRFGLAGFLVFLAPVSNVIPLYFQWQDRYVSLALWPLGVALGAGIEAWAAAPGTRRWAPRAAVGLLALALGARTAQYVGRWRDALTLFGHAASTQPDSYYAWLNLGHLRARAGQLEGAVEAYGRAIEAANLGDAHGARFRTVLRIDERDLGLRPSRADEMTARFQRGMSHPAELRALGGELADLGYRRAVTLALDYLLALSPISNRQLERAAAAQLARGHGWLADYYLSRLTRPPELPSLVERVRARGRPPGRATRP